MAGLWPSHLKLDIKSGFDDAYLSYLSEESIRNYDKDLGYKYYPWQFWTTETYSFGKCYRDWLGWPKFIPLPFYGDHGVCFKGEFQEHERVNKARYHVTWFKERYENTKRTSFKSLIRIPHPWITYRRKKGIMIRSDSSGTLVFLSHSVTGIELMDYNFERYFNSLKKLPDEYKPFVICMHMNDIKKGLHKKIREYDFPIISAGNTSSQFFVDRFYDIASRFSYATSNVGGSEVFYCTEMGLKYFIFGDEPKFYNFSHVQNPIGVLLPTDEIEKKSIEKKNKIFREFPPRITNSKIEFCEKVLGLDVDSSFCKKKLKRIVFKEFFRFLPYYIFKATCLLIMISINKIVDRRVV